MHNTWGYNLYCALAMPKQNAERFAMFSQSINNTVIQTNRELPLQTNRELYHFGGVGCE
jgi:hypothetical protein